MASPYSTLLIPTSHRYLRSLELELPFLLVEAISSITSSPYLHYSAHSPPKSRRLSSMSREKMLAETLIHVHLTFIFDPRKSTPREQHTLESAELLTRKGVRENFTNDPEHQDDLDMAEVQATEAARKRGKSFSSFYFICSTYLVADVCPGKNPGVTTAVLLRATMRKDAFVNPAKGSGNWFKFLKKRLESPQPFFDCVEPEEIYELTDAEREIAVAECRRRIAVVKFGYPAEREYDESDGRVSLVLKIFGLGMFKIPKGTGEVFDELLSESDANMLKEVIALEPVYRSDGVRKVLALRRLEK
ncbi:hypothetical protein P7C70_g7602, partial [Phenoliferia sp. Uapishka_3]